MVSFRLDRDRHDALKAAAAARGTTITAAFTEWVDRYVAGEDAALVAADWLPRVEALERAIAELRGKAAPVVAAVEVAPNTMPAMPSGCLAIAHDKPGAAIPYLPANWESLSFRVQQALAEGRITNHSRYSKDGLIEAMRAYIAGDEIPEPPHKS